MPGSVPAVEGKWEAFIHAFYLVGGHWFFLLVVLLLET